jgi:hypothetical protein
VDDESGSTGQRRQIPIPCAGALESARGGWSEPSDTAAMAASATCFMAALRATDSVRPFARWARSIICQTRLSLGPYRMQPPASGSACAAGWSCWVIQRRTSRMMMLKVCCSTFRPVTTSAWRCTSSQSGSGGASPSGTSTAR